MDAHCTLMKILLSLLCVIIPFGMQAQFNDFADLNVFLEESFDAMGPAVAIEIAQDGMNIHGFKTGFANIETRTPVTDSSLFGVASISKQFTAASIYLLQVQGKLTVEDDIRTYLTDFPFYADTIRIKHLLHHTSGIRNYNVLAYLSGGEDNFNSNAEVYDALLRQRAVNNSPGFRMLYSNSNYVLLAMIVEQVAGKLFPQFVRDQLFRPLGMQSAFFVSETQSDTSLRVSRYIQTKTGFKPSYGQSMVAGPGGMGCTVKELIQWSTLFSEHYGFDADLMAFLRHDEPLTSGEANSYKHGVFESKYRGYTVVHHSGRTEGSRSQLIALPALNLSVVLCAGTNAYNLEAISYKVLDFLLGEHADEPQAELIKTFPFPDAFLGDYQEIHSDLGMVIYEQNDTLFAKSSFGAEGVELVAVDPLKYCRRDNRSVTYTFVEESDAHLRLEVDFSGATFKFEQVTLADAAEVVLSEFAGDYYSDELAVSYHFDEAGDLLTLSFAGQTDLPLHLCRTDEFGSYDRTLFSFDRSDEGEIVGFYLASEGTVFNIYFEKTN